MAQSFIDQAIASGEMMMKGAAAFGEGVQSLAQSRAYNDANEQLQNLNSQEMSKEQRLQAQSQVGNQLAMRLGAAGASPQSILVSADRLAPSASEQFQSQANTESQAQGFKNNTALQAQRIQGQKEIEQMKLDQMKTAMGFKTAKMQDAYGKEFFTQNKDDIQSLKKYDDAKQTIADSNGSPIGPNLAQMEFVKAAVGRSNWQEIQMADQNQSAKQKLARAVGIQLTNKDTTDNVSFWNKIVDGAKDKTMNRMQAAADGFAAGKAALEPGVNASQLAEALKQQHLSKFGYQSGTSSAAAPPAGTQTITPKQGITSPINSNDPDAQFFRKIGP